MRQPVSLALLPKVRRIYVIGAPGSGKSFLAERLSQTLKLPWHDLDGDDVDAMSNGDRSSFSQCLRQQNQWICEGTVHGIGIDWVRAADLTVILTTPMPVRSFRVIRRAVWKKLGKHFPGQPGSESWASLRYRLGLTWHYQKRILSPFLEKLHDQHLSALHYDDNWTAYHAVLKMLNIDSQEC